MKTKKTIGLLCCLSATLLSAPSWAGGDARKGADVFAEECGDCHSAIAGKNKKGPTLNGIFGRKAGSAEGFKYSDGMAKSGITWDDASLDKWLTDTKAVVPGNKMTFALKDPKQREDVIAYLKTQ